MKAFEKPMEEGKGNRVAICKELFCKQLKELRAEKELSQKELAKRLGVAVSTYANWEQGRRAPSIYDVFNLLRVLEIEANELFDITY